MVVLQTNGMTAAMVEAAISQANLVFANSQVNVTFRLVDIFQRTTAPQTGISDARRLELLAEDPEVNSRRNLVGADIVLLISGSMVDCGLAYPGPDARVPFALLNPQCTGSQYYSIAHELGHLLGGDHNFEDRYFGTTYNFDWPSFRDAYTQPIAGGANRISCFYTTLAYPTVPQSLEICRQLGYIRVPYFSNPNVRYQNFVIGDPRWSNNSRKLNESVSIVESFRGTTIAGNQLNIKMKLINIMRMLLD